MNITIDTEFRTLIPPLTAEEFSQLEANCLENGIQDSLKTWSGILVDGHNRYEIAEKHGLSYKTDEMEFESRDDVKLWIIKNQLGRRNLSAYVRSVLALKLKPVIAEKAKERQSTHTEQGYQKSDKAEHTAKELAKVAGDSHDTIHKVETIEKSDNEEVKQAVRNKEMSIDKAYREVKGLPPKKNPNPHLEVTEAEVNVTNSEVMKNPRHIEERSIELACENDDGEEVEDVAKDATETAGLAYADEILSGITKIMNTVKYNRANVIDEISKLDCKEFSRDEFLASVNDGIKMLIKLKNALDGFTVRTN